MALKASNSSNLDQLALKGLRIKYVRQAIAQEANPRPSECTKTVADHGVLSRTPLTELTAPHTLLGWISGLTVRAGRGG